MLLRRCRSTFSIAAVGLLAFAYGCGSTDGFRTDASGKQVKAKALAPMPVGAAKRTLAIQPVVMSRLVTVAPEITLSSSELCELVTERTKREFFDSQQFQIVEPGQPAHYVLRCEITELMIGPETTVSGFRNIFSSKGSGHEDDSSKIRPLDMMIEGELVDARTGSPMLRGNGGAKRDIRLSQTVNASGTYTNTNGNTSSTISGYKFDQQHLQEVFRTAANELAFDVCQKANLVIFQPEAQARNGASGGNAAAFSSGR